MKQPPPGLIFYKAISIAPLSADAKAVAAALFDHFNCKTNQLDPSQASLARRLGIDRRAINDAINDLARFGLFTRHSHGGKSYRSSYQPNVALAALMVEDFEGRRKSAVAPSEASPLHPKNRPPKRSRRAQTSGDGATAFGRQSSGHGATGGSGDGATGGRGDGATQTPRINSLNLTRRAHAEKSHPSGGGSLALGRRASAAPRPPSEAQRRRAQAAGAWQRDLLKYSSDLYKILVPTLTETDPAYVAATEAELARPGGGLASILAATGPPSMNHLNRKQAHDGGRHEQEK